MLGVLFLVPRLPVEKAIFVRHAGAPRAIALRADRLLDDDLCSGREIVRAERNFAADLSAVAVAVEVSMPLRLVLVALFAGVAIDFQLCPADLLVFGLVHDSSLYA